MKRPLPSSAGGTGRADAHPIWLEQATSEAGRLWAQQYRAVLMQERRAPSGGWPGTLTEARSVASACLAGVVVSRAPRFTPKELDLAARLVNASARRDWLIAATRETPEPPFDDEE